MKSHQINQRWSEYSQPQIETAPTAVLMEHNDRLASRSADSSCKTKKRLTTAEHADVKPDTTSNLTRAMCVRALQGPVLRGLLQSNARGCSDWPVTLQRALPVADPCFRNASPRARGIPVCSRGTACGAQWFIPACKNRRRGSLFVSLAAAQANKPLFVQCSAILKHIKQRKLQQKQVND